MELDFLSDYNDQVSVVIEHYISPKSRKKRGLNAEAPKDYLHDLLNTYLGRNVVIPYNLKERKKMFPKAFNDLKNYMLKYF
jgi:hypothetical protein